MSSNNQRRVNQQPNEQNILLDESQIPQGFPLETKIRQLIQEIIDPALKKTENCVKSIEYFSQVLDENNKKFDHCYDVYEVLNEKTKIRFNEVDALTQKAASIDSDQIINNGWARQETKELRQEIQELKDSITHKTEQLQSLKEGEDIMDQTTNEKLQDEMIKLNNKILDTKGEYQEKMGDFIKNHFAGFTNIQKEFSKIKEEFIMANRGMDYHKQVFDELQSSLDLYKVERIDFKKKIESISHQIDDKLQKSDFLSYSERIEHSLVNGNDELRLELQKFQKESISLTQNHTTLINGLKKNEDIYKQSFKDIHHLINESKTKTESTIASILMENTEMKNEQKVVQKSIEDINNSLISQANITNDLKQNIRKELLKFDQLVNDIQKNQMSVIEETINTQIEKIKLDLKSEFGDLMKQAQKQIKTEQNEKNNTNNQNTLSKDNSQSFPQQDSVDAAVQVENQQLSFNSEHIEEIIYKSLEKNVPQIIKNEAIKEKLMKKDIELMIERSSALLLDKVEQNMKKNMVTESSLTDIKRDILKIEELKNQMKGMFQQMKDEHEHMNEKVERMTYKLTTIQSDITIENEFINGQIKKVIKDKDQMQKTLKCLALLTSNLTENIYITHSILLSQEYERRQSQDLFENFNNTTIPSRFYSNQDGLIFEINQDSQRIHPCKLNYRSQNIEKYDLLRHSMSSTLQQWDYIIQTCSDEFIDNTPGRIFSTQMLQKIKYDLKPIRASTSGKYKPKHNDSDIMNKSLLVESNHNNNNTFMNKTFNTSQNNNNVNNSNQYSQIPNISQIKTTTEIELDGKRKKNSSITLNHRKLLKNLKDFNQTHLINLQKQITKPQTVEKQYRKQSSSTIQQSEMHKINLTFANSMNDTLKNNYTDNL